MTLPELYKQDKVNSGTIVLLPYIKDCDKLYKEINKIAGAEIAMSYHRSKKIKKKKLKEYSILIMTHARFVKGTEDIASYAYWTDFEKLHDLSNEPIKRMRKRLIVDESINKIETTSISNKSLARLNEFFQNQQNKANYKEWLSISNKISEFFVLPVQELERNKTIKVTLQTDSSEDFEISKRLYQSINLYGNASIQADFKAIINLAKDGGVLKIATNQKYREIKTVSFINIFQPLFSNIILDGTARADATYKNTKHFHLIDMPRTKTYELVTIHVDPKTSASRSAIEKNPALISRTIQFITDTLQDKKVLLICHKGHKDKFTGLPKNVAITHWNGFNGSNEYNMRDCIVYVGIPYLDETHYMLLYHTFAKDDDYSKSTVYKPSGKTDPVMRFVGEPRYEDIRQSCLVTELIQSINRGICRNYENTTIMHCFLPYNDKQVVERLITELPGVNIEYDYPLIEETKQSSVKKGSEEKVKLVDAVVDIILGHRYYFESETINKSDIFALGYISNNFKCKSKAAQSNVWKSPRLLELVDSGFIEFGKNNKTIRFLDVA